jgi:hypothetical protein
MRIRRIPTAMALAAACLVLAAPPCRAQPLDDDGWIRRTLEEILDANDEQTVLEKRAALLKRYRVRNGQQRGFGFARSVAAHSRPLLAAGPPADDALRKVKLVNVALAVSLMPQATIQPALDLMVRHENPAVRYFGWRGYWLARTRLLGQGAEFVDRMFAALEERAGREDSPSVLGELFRMLVMRPDRPVGVSAETWQAARRRTVDLLGRHWGAGGRGLADDPEMAAAARVLVQAAREHAAAGGAEQHQAAAQWLFELACHASRVYLRAPYGEALSNAQGMLLRACEGALNAVAGTEHRLIETALQRDEPPYQPPVRLAVIQGWKTALKERGIEVRQPANRPPASQPAATTTPAAGG